MRGGDRDSTHQALRAGIYRASQVELLCRAKTDRRIKSLTKPAGLAISFAYAEKGSYRAANIIDFLAKWLEPMSAERHAARDYRLLYLDVARSHLDPSVADFAWTRGYLTLYHFGGTTGVAQVNDTDLHAEMEKIYQEFEQLSFNYQQRFEPGNINRSLQQVADDLAATWKTLNHKHGVAGHKRVGLSNRLDGSEDHLLSRTARQLWIEADIPSLRAGCIAEVDEKVANGQVASIADWRGLVVNPTDPGIREEEGAELEPALAEGEASWYEAGEYERLQADDLKLDEEQSAPVVVVAAPDDKPADVEEATLAAGRLEQLKKLRVAIRIAKVPSAGFLVDKQITHLERGLYGGSAGRVSANMTLRRHIEGVMAKEAAEVKAKRALAFQAAQNRVRVIIARRRAAARKALIQEAKDDLKKKLDELPVHVTSAMCSAAGKKGIKARSDCLERLKLRSPALPPELDSIWKDVRDSYSAECAKTWEKKKLPTAVGFHFLQKVNEVLAALGPHYKGPTKCVKKATADYDKDAFFKFFEEMRASIPTSACTAVL